MLILFIGLLMLVAGVIIGCRNDWFGGLEVVLTIFGAMATVISVVAIMVVNIPAQTEYEKELYKREVLMYRLENRDEEITDNELLYTEIVEFNNNLRDTKRLVKNPFTNWFYNQLIAEKIDYIQIEGVNIAFDN